jgi:hypothetical protein
MTPAELRKLLDAATPGPWAAQFGGFHCTVESDASVDVASCEAPADGRAIVALRNHADALLRVAEAAEALRQLRQEADGLDDICYDALDKRLGEAMDALFAALAALREVKP